MELENKVDQPPKESPDNDNQPNMYEVNGQKMTPEQIIESYNNLQGEFTKKSQKLSEYEKKGLKIEELEKTEKIKEEETNFNSFKSEFTTLSEYQYKTIRDLKAINPDKSFDEIAKSYGMLDDAQIERSKRQKNIVGNNIGIKSNKKEEITLTDKAIRIHNIKSREERSKIISNFGL